MKDNDNGPHPGPGELRDISPEFLELNVLLVKAWLTPELWHPPAPVPEEIMTQWPDFRFIGTLIKIKAGTPHPLKDEAEARREVNMIRAMRYFHMKHPDFVVPEEAIQNLRASREEE